VTPVLIDTSVWRRYFAGKATRQQAEQVGALLDEDGVVLVHAAVLGELVLGGLSVREERLFERLPAARELSNTEVLSFVRRRKLLRRGIGWVDVHLLASTLLARAQLWSFDTALSNAAAELDVAFKGSPKH
jgi:predicted nucleic acid-binding protein